MGWFRKSSSSRKESSEGSNRSAASHDDGASDEQPTFSSAPKAPTRRMTKSDKALMATSQWSAMSKLKLEDPVSLADSKACVLQGVVAYVGEVDFTDGVWVGVQLTGPSVGKGYNDGSVNGKRYFGSVGKKNGVFCHISKIQRRVKTNSGDPEEDRRQQMRQTPKAQLAEIKYVDTLKKEREAALLKQSEEKKKFQLRNKGEPEEKYIQRLKLQSLQELRVSRNEPAEGEELLTLPGPKLKFGSTSSNLCKADYDFMQGLQDAQQNFVLTDPTLPDNPVTFASQAFLNMTEYSLSEILGKNCRFLQGKNTSKQAVARIRLAIEEGSDCSICLLNYRKTGQAFWNEFFITALRDNRGRVKNYIGVQCEVSEEAAAMRNKTAAFIASRSSFSQVPGAVDELAQPDDNFSEIIEEYSPLPEISNPDRYYRSPQPMVMEQVEQQRGVKPIPSIMPGRYGEGTIMQPDVRFRHLQVIRETEDHPSDPPSSIPLNTGGATVSSKPRDPSPTRFDKGKHIGHVLYPGSTYSESNYGDQSQYAESQYAGSQYTGASQYAESQYTGASQYTESQYTGSQYSVSQYSVAPSSIGAYSAGQYIQPFPHHQQQQQNRFSDGMSSVGISSVGGGDGDDHLSRASRSSRGKTEKNQDNSRRTETTRVYDNSSISNDTRSQPSMIQSSISSYAPSKYSFDDQSLGANSEQFLPSNLEAKNYVVFPGMSLTQLEVGWPGEDADGDDTGTHGTGSKAKQE